MAAGKKAWQRRKVKERNNSIARIPASFLPGYGAARGVYKAYKAEKELSKSKKKK